VVVTAVPFAAQLATGRALTAQGSTGSIAVATLIAGAANIGLNVLLIPLLGLNGSAGATLVSYVLLNALLRLKARRVAPTTAPSWSLRLQLAVAVGVALASAALPATGVALWPRIVVVLLTMAWFVRLLVQANRPTGPREGRTGDASLTDTELLKIGEIGRG
jgi:O-antigen/teichoic acid export membrane protein